MLNFKFVGFIDESEMVDIEVVDTIGFVLDQLCPETVFDLHLDMEMDSNPDENHETIFGDDPMEIEDNNQEEETNQPTRRSSRVSSRRTYADVVGNF